jgi:hypothetical protein
VLCAAAPTYTADYLQLCPACSRHQNLAHFDGELCQFLSDLHSSCNWPPFAARHFWSVKRRFIGLRRCDRFSSRIYTHFAVIFGLSCPQRRPDTLTRSSGQFLLPRQRPCARTDASPSEHWHINLARFDGEFCQFCRDALKLTFTRPVIGPRSPRGIFEALNVASSTCGAVTAFRHGFIRISR